jgi:hypothetical protein
MKANDYRRKREAAGIGSRKNERNIHIEEEVTNTKEGERSKREESWIKG